MPRLHVVLDSNAYIGMPTAGLPDLILRERSNGVVPWASYFVVEELMARCASTDARRAGAGIAAIGRLSNHCQMYDGSYERINFVADPRQQVALFLYGRGTFPEQRVIDTYGTVVKTIAANPDRTTWPSWVQKATSDVAAEIEGSEAAYVSTMFKSIVDRLSPGATTWGDVRSNRTAADALADGIASDEGLDLCARMFAEELADLVGVTATDEQLQRAGDTLKTTFQLPLRLHNALMYRIVKDGADVSRPELANTVWDVQLALTIPLEASRTPVWLITNEKMILNAAKDAGAEHVVHSLTSYIELTRDGDALRAMIGRFLTG